MAKKDNQPLMTFIVYITRNNLPTHIDGFLSSLAYLKEKKEIQIIFVNANDDEEITKVIKNYCSELKIFYFKISSDLGQGYAYNLTIPHIEGKYCHFITPTYTIEPNYFDNIKKTCETNTIAPDLMLLYNPHALNNYELENLTYKGLSKELILGINSNLKYVLINTEFLLKYDLHFQDFVFHPFTFISNMLADASLITYIPTKLIDSRFKTCKNFNAYDVLYQAYDVLSFLNQKGIYEKYANEWNYLLIVNVYRVFLKMLARSYSVDLNSKSSIKSQNKVFSTALLSIKNIVNKLKINVQENPYVVANESKIFDIYNKITKVIK